MMNFRPSNQLLSRYKSIYEEYKNRLTPNKKSTDELISYVKTNYFVDEITDPKWNQVVIDNVLHNEFINIKLNGEKPESIVFAIQNIGNGKNLYNEKYATPIFVGIEKKSGYFIVDGPEDSKYPDLWDELFVFSGLDAMDLQNYVLVGMYIECLNKFDVLSSVLS